MRYSWVAFFFVGLVLLLTTLLALLNDNQYRNVLVWSADTFMDARLEIKNHFSLDFGSNILLKADAFQLHANDGSYKLDVGSIDGSMRFGDYIKTGTFWINSLALADVRLGIIESDSAEQNQGWDLYVPPVIIKTVQIENLSVVYTPVGEDQPHTFDMEKLAIDEVQDQGSIKVSGSMVFNKRSFAIEGTLGSLAKLEDTAEPYPIDLAIRSDELVASLSGTIDDLVSGEGLALKLKVDDKNLTRTLRSFDKTLPELGNLELSTLLVGTYDAPRFEKIDLLVQRDNGIELTLRGELDGITQLSKASLAATLKATELTDFSELLDSSLPALGAVDASGSFSAQDGEFSLEDVKLVLGPSDKPVIKADGVLQRDKSGKSRIQLNFDGTVDEIVHAIEKTQTPKDLGRLQGSLAVTELNGNWKVEKIKLDSSETDLYQLRVDATSEQGAVLHQLGLHTSLQIPDPAKLGAQIGIDLGGHAAYQAEGVLKVNENEFSYLGKTQVGKTHSNLELNATLVGDKPVIKGKFSIPELYLSDIGIDQQLLEASDVSSEPGSSTPMPQKTSDAAPVPEVSQPKPADAGQYIFEREKFNFELLQGIDLDLAISVDKIVGVNYSVEGLNGHIKLADGNLQIKPLRLIFESGEMNIELELNTAGTPQFSFSAVASKVKLTHLIEQLQQEVPVEGHGDLKIELKSQGHSAHEMASALSGKVDLTLENALIPRIYITYLSVDMFGWVLTPTADSHARLDCAMVDFDIDKGIAKSSLIIADGPNLSVEGNSTLDFGKETIDMVLLPTQKREVFSQMSPINIEGPLADPVITSIPAEAAATKIGAVLLIPVVALPVLLFEKLFGNFDSDDDAGVGCSKLVAELKKKSSAK